jgi:DNA polymerase I-like protein with 3'-5' exonuclease and polymerase domains
VPWVFHNVAFDFWVLWEVLSPSGRALLHDKVEIGHVHDTMLLELLIVLATTGGQREGVGFKPPTLDELTTKWGNLRTPKDDPYRQRYGEIVGVPFADVTDRGFWDYAILDAVNLATVWPAMSAMAFDLSVAAIFSPSVGTYEVAPYALAQFGPLSETIQVKAAIALADISRRGIAVDQQALRGVDQKLRDEMTDLVRWIKDHYPQLLTYYKEKKRAGVIRVNKKTRVPRLQLKELRGLLLTIERDLDRKAPRTGKTKEISASLDVWRNLAPHHPLVEKWTRLADVGKLLQFTTKITGVEVVRSGYRTLVSTGRTSASGPNIQQQPRDAWFRQLFVPRPGYKLVAADYSFIELRTLASVCLSKFGRSKLADVIRDGTDPHAYTAAMTLGMSLDNFKVLKTSDPAGYKRNRQAAKAINFGVPGGLGAARLAVYAKTTYGVDMSQETAKALKAQLTEEVYPEIGEYLADSSLADLAAVVKQPLAKVRRALEPKRQDDIAMQAVRKIIKGTPYTVDGRHYYPVWVEQVWEGLETLMEHVDDPKVREAVARHEGSNWLEGELFNKPVATRTGRVRADVGYTEARNTPFQGLAADGAKLALWRAVMDGALGEWPGRLVAFLHDEIVAEVPIETADRDARHLETVMNTEMQQVLHPLVPSACEVVIGDRWTKA